MEYLAGMIELAPKKDAPPAVVASICARLGRADEAFEWLERAFETHDWFLISLAVNPLYDSIRADPRYPPFLKRLGLEHVKPAA